jgi:hypothetical protein
MGSVRRAKIEMLQETDIIAHLPTCFPNQTRQMRQMSQTGQMGHLPRHHLYRACLGLA